jgi:hypothetical protein
MLKIGKKPSPSRLDLCAGAWLDYRPMTTVDREAGFIAARKCVEAVRDGKLALADYGMGAIDGGGLLDADMAYGISSAISLTEIGLRCISAWHGVADEAGAPLALNRTNLAALLQDPVYYEMVFNALTARLVEWDAEGNGCAPSPNGGPAGAQPIAETAAS